MACASIGTCRSRWMTVSFCAPTSSGRSTKGRYPVDHELRAVRQGPARSRTAYKGRVGQHDRATIPEVAAGSTNKYQNWEVVDPEKWVPDGYVCVRVDSPRRRSLAGRDRRLVAARDPGLSRLHRMGRGAALVQRQGRPQRHLLLRDEPMVRRRTAAAASGRDLRVGGRRRLLPRPLASRRHSVHFLGTWFNRAAVERQHGVWRPRRAQPGHRRVGGGAGDAAGRAAGRNRIDPRHRGFASARSTATITASARRSSTR